MRDIRDIRRRPPAHAPLLCAFSMIATGVGFAYLVATNAMTCLIEEDLTVLRISGRLTAEQLEVLRAAVEEERGDVAIDLRDVGLIDGDAVRFLALIEADGGALRNCPAYIREWVNRERAQTRADQSEA